MKAATHSTDNTFLGICLMFGFVLFGPMIDISAKIAASEVPVFQIAAARFLVQGALLLPLLLALGWPGWPSRRDALLYLLRGGLILGSTATIVGAVKFMPVADAIAIVFVEPLILLLLGWAFLGEGIGPRRLLACVVGFIGAMLVIQPSFERFGWTAVLPLGTALFFAFYLLLTRAMSRRTDPLALQVFTSGASLVLAVPVLLLADGSGIEWIDPVRPSSFGLFWMAAVGLAATVSHLFLSYAFRFAPVSVLGTIHYLELVTATLYGWLVFGDLLNGRALAGALIVVSAGLFLIWRERRAWRKVPPQPVRGSPAAGS